MKLHIVTGLNTGGAEKALYRLLTSSKASDVLVVSLTSKGVIGIQLEELGFRVVALNLKPYNFLLVLYRLYKIHICYNPSLVQTWLYHSDLIGGLVAKLAGVQRIIWGIRTTELRKGSYSTASIRKLSAWLSHLIPTKIVVVAEKAKQKHIALGYDASKMVVIPNGFNMDAFVAPPDSVYQLKHAVGIEHDHLVIGCVGRLSQVKGQDVLIKAAGSVLKRFPNVMFLMVGRGLEKTNAQVRALIDQYAQAGNFILLGERSDVPVCLKAMDVFCLPSRSEGFPNALGEAMLSGVACVSTDAGDAAVLGGSDVPIVKVDDPDDLATQLIKMIEKTKEERTAIGQRLRQRIVEEYSLEKMVRRYEALYQEIEVSNK